MIRLINKHSVMPYESDWTKQQNKSFVKVHITVENNGEKKTGRIIFSDKEWKQIEKQGYILT